MKKRVKLVEVCYEFGQSVAVFATIRQGKTKEKHSCWVANKVRSFYLQSIPYTFGLSCRQNNVTMSNTPPVGLALMSRPSLFLAIPLL